MNQIELDNTADTIRQHFENVNDARNLAYNRSRSLIMMKPSRFLSEIDQDLTEQMVLEEGLPHLTGGEEN